MTRNCMKIKEKNIQAGDKLFQLAAVNKDNNRFLKTKITAFIAEQISWLDNMT